MKIDIKQLGQCIIILFRTSTKPKSDWFWMFSTVFQTLFKNPSSIFNRKNEEAKKHFLSDYLPHPITVKTIEGISFVARPKYEDLARFLFSKTVAKWEPISIIKPQEKDVIVDVGANVGYYTLRLAHSVRNGKIVSIEADPQTCEILKTNCKLNNFENVEIYNYAITDKEGEITLYQSDTHSGSNSIFVKNSSKSRKQTSVKATTLDDLLENKYDEINWIKIDVEGAELSVLKGAEKTLKKTKRILVEIHEHILRQNNEKPEEVIEILKNNDFKIKLLDNNWDPETSPNQTLKCDYILGEK